MRVYERALRGMLEHPLVFAVFGLAVIAGSYFCYRALGSDLLPGMDEGGFIVDYIMPAGSSLEDTNRAVSAVERILRRDAGGGEHFAAHGAATGAGDSDGSQYAATFREAEAQARAAAPRK